MPKRRKTKLRGAAGEHEREFHRTLRKSLDLLDSTEEEGPCRGGEVRLAEAMRWLGMAQSNLFYAPPTDGSRARWGLLAQTQRRILKALREETSGICAPVRPRAHLSQDGIETGEMDPILRGLAALRRPRRR